MNQIYKSILEDIKSMSLKEHLWYWIIPLISLSIFIVMYFSTIPILVSIICPPANWEWGVLENLQLLVIIGILVISVKAIAKRKELLLKFGFFFIAVFSVFVMLEEIDYGTHFIHLIEGKFHSYLTDSTGFYNLHNQGNNAKLFKRSVYGLMLLIFVVAPFLKNQFRNKYLSYLIPQPKILIVAVLCIVIDLVPRLLVKFNILVDGGLGVNIGEFSEVTVYYIFLIYIHQLVFINKLAPAEEQVS